MKCTVEGCEDKARRLAMCTRHYTRLRRHGDPSTVLPGGMKRGSRPAWLSSEGYLVRVDPAPHPTASVDGRTYVHRAVLYDTIGPGSHPCHWCSKPVTWELSWPSSKDALVVDHLDNSKTNNEPANLVPSCGPCNCHRNPPLHAANGRFLRSVVVIT